MGRHTGRRKNALAVCDCQVLARVLQGLPCLTIGDDWPVSCFWEGPSGEPDESPAGVDADDNFPRDNGCMTAQQCMLLEAAANTGGWGWLCVGHPAPLRELTDSVYHARGNKRWAVEGICSLLSELGWFAVDDWLCRGRKLSACMRNEAGRPQ